MHVDADNNISATYNVVCLLHYTAVSFFLLFLSSRKTTINSIPGVRSDFSFNECARIEYVSDASAVFSYETESIFLHRVLLWCMKRGLATSGPHMLGRKTQNISAREEWCVHLLLHQ